MNWSATVRAWNNGATRPSVVPGLPCSPAWVRRMFRIVAMRRLAAGARPPLSPPDTANRPAGPKEEVVVVPGRRPRGPVGQAKFIAGELGCGLRQQAALGCGQDLQFTNSCPHRPPSWASGVVRTLYRKGTSFPPHL